MKKYGLLALIALLVVSCSKDTTIYQRDFIHPNYGKIIKEVNWSSLDTTWNTNTSSGYFEFQMEEDSIWAYSKVDDVYFWHIKLNKPLFAGGRIIKSILDSNSGLEYSYSSAWEFNRIEKLSGASFSGAFDLEYDEFGRLKNVDLYDQFYYAFNYIDDSTYTITANDYTLRVVSDKMPTPTFLSKAMPFDFDDFDFASFFQCWFVQQLGNPLAVEVISHTPGASNRTGDRVDYIYAYDTEGFPVQVTQNWKFAPRNQMRRYKTVKNSISYFKN